MRPPRLSEILFFPLLGVLAIDAFMTKHNELLFFFMPFAFVFVRMYLTQFRVPTHPGDPAGPPSRRFRNYLAWEYLATLVLLLLEAGAVVAGSPSTPRELWAAVGGLYVVYVLLRLAARSAWGRAADSWCVASELPTEPNARGRT